MYQADAWIRAYDGPSDTCTVELAGVGVIDTWIDGIKIDASLNRAVVIAGNRATVTMPDAHRICEAMVTAIQPGATSPATVSVPPPSGTTPASQITQNGGGIKQTTNTGFFNVGITFPTPFSSTAGLQIAAAIQGGYAGTISAVSLTGFTLQANTPVHLTFLEYSWQATGPA